MKAAAAVVALVMVTLSPAARADDADARHAEKLAPYYRWRWEAGVGGVFGALRLRQQDLGPGGLALTGGIRNHDLAIVADYRMLGVSWKADGSATRGDPTWMTRDTAGTAHRLALVARYNFLTFSLDKLDRDFTAGHEFLELFVEAGVGGEQIDWERGGQLWRADGQLGGGVRIHGWRIAKNRTLGIIFHAAELLSRRPGNYDTSPTCSGPCDRATPPTAWDRGIMVTIGAVFSS